MGWCLNCHRDPTPNLRDPKDITKMGLTEQASIQQDLPPKAERPADLRKPIPPTNCSGCHR
jgi:hypothetical protein